MNFGRSRHTRCGLSAGDDYDFAVRLDNGKVPRHASSRLRDGDGRVKKRA
jgi:hypothetical protein